MWGGVCFMTRFLKELPCLWVMVTSLFLPPLSSVRKGRVLWPDDLLTGLGAHGAALESRGSEFGPGRLLRGLPCSPINNTGDRSPVSTC